MAGATCVRSSLVGQPHFIRQNVRDVGGGRNGYKKTFAYKRITLLFCAPPQTTHAANFNCRANFLRSLTPSPSFLRIAADLPLWSCCNPDLFGQRGANFGLVSLLRWQTLFIVLWRSVVFSNSSHCLTLSWSPPFNSNLISFLFLSILSKNLNYILLRWVVVETNDQFLCLDFQNMSKRDKEEARTYLHAWWWRFIKVFQTFRWEKNKRWIFIREKFIRLIRGDIFASEVLGNRDCYLRTIESGRQRDPL